MGHGNPNQTILKEQLEEMGFKVRINHNQFWINGKLVGTKNQARWFIEENGGTPRA